MGALRQSQTVETKHKLSHTLRNWLPILHSSLCEIEEAMEPFIQANPLVRVESGYEENFEKKIPKKILYGTVSNSRTEQIEALTIQKQSLYDLLDEQITAPLFPTPHSQKIAYFIIENLDENGYYEGDTQSFCTQHNISLEYFEKIHQRFAYIDPVGIGASNLQESFLYQLQNTTISSEGYTLAKTIIKDLENIHTYAKHSHFQEAIEVITSFKNPPNIDFLEDSQEIIPDLMIYFNDNHDIEVKLNDEYYPTIVIENEYSDNHPFIKEKLKEAKSLIDALEMRKATLYKVGLMIVEYQYEFFTGGAIMPLTLKTLADEFGHNPSTISRAIANKYIACDRGIFAMKEFFTTAIDEDISNATIKSYLSELIKNEPRQKPLSDMKLLEMIQTKFQIKMVRRTIAKYRKQLNIAGSSERKKLYKLNISS